MRRPVQTIARDFAKVLKNISSRVDASARDERARISQAIVESIEEVLPQADVVLSQGSDRHFVDVTDENLLARERGSLLVATDAPIARALERVLRG